MEKELIVSDRCIGCGLCAKVCIRGHLALGADRRIHEVESQYSCFRCGHCLAVCPKDAIRLRRFASESPAEASAPVDAGSLMMLYRQRRSHRWFDRKCSADEIERMISSTRYSPTAENSQAVEFAVVDARFDEFMRLCASILRTHTDEHPRLRQFVDYVESGMEGRNNPFTWEGRQVIIAFSRLPIDSAIAMEQMELMAFSMGLGGFHSRWILQASENDPDAFMSFFPEIREDLTASAAFVVGHPRMEYKRTSPREGRTIIWK